MCSLEVIVPHLPDVNVTMSHHDGPSVFMDWKTKQRHLDHARAGKGATHMFFFFFPIPLSHLKFILFVFVLVLPPELIDHVEDDAR
jgi:hypothetical protein